jgi:hypothetical protein
MTDESQRPSDAEAPATPGPLQTDVGQLRLVPEEPSDELVREVLYNINRKRRNEDELTASDVREVVRNLHFQGPYSPKAGAALPRGDAFLGELVRELAQDVPGDLASQARDLLRKEVWYGMTDLEIEHGCSVLAKEAVAAIVAALRISLFVGDVR